MDLSRFDQGAVGLGSGRVVGVVKERASAMAVKRDGVLIAGRGVGFLCRLAERCARRDDECDRRYQKCLRSDGSSSV